MTDSNTIAFNSYNEHFLLSNMFPVILEYKNGKFFGVDHLFHYLLFYRHPNIQKEIMKKSKGICANYTAKKISEANKDLIKDITAQQRINLLKKCVMLKFQQSKHCRDYLISTRGKRLIEFAFWGDTFWGCMIKDGEFIGENHTGRILMEIRDSLIERA